MHSFIEKRAACEMGKSELPNFEKLHGVFVLRSRADVKAYVNSQRSIVRSIGFVPTMGALHQGHAFLLNEAVRKHACVLLSVFVNPAQFGPGEDFSTYPRAFDDDVKLAAACGVSAVFAPSVDEIYPQGFATTVFVNSNWSSLFEGQSRPSHFQGVCLVVLILLNLVAPDEAFFGMKDYQQVAVLGRLVADLGHPTVLTPLPTVRDFDGLALSSRNRYLSVEARAVASAIPRSLAVAAQLFLDGERRFPVLVAEVRRCFSSLTEGIEQHIHIDYLDWVSVGQLHQDPACSDAAILIAVKVHVSIPKVKMDSDRPQESASSGRDFVKQDQKIVRLLDNLILSQQPEWLSAARDLIGRVHDHEEEVENV